MKRQTTTNALFGLDLLCHIAANTFRYYNIKKISIAESWTNTHTQLKIIESSSSLKSFRVCGNEFIDEQMQLEFGKFSKLREKKPTDVLSVHTIGWRKKKIIMSVD